MPKPTPIKNPLAALVDELGALEAKAATWKATLGRIEALRKLLRASVEDLPAAQGRNIYGEKYTAVIGTRENERTVNVTKLSNLISTRALLGVVTVPLSALVHIAPEIAAQAIDVRQTGSRPLKVFSKE